MAGSRFHGDGFQTLIADATEPDSAISLTVNASTIHRIWLYEVYKDEAAFQDHLKAPHFAVFKKAADKWRVEGIQGSARGSMNLYPTDANWR